MCLLTSIAAIIQNYKKRERQLYIDPLQHEPNLRQ